MKFQPQVDFNFNFEVEVEVEPKLKKMFNFLKLKGLSKIGGNKSFGDSKPHVEIRLWPILEAPAATMRTQ